MDFSVHETYGKTVGILVKNRVSGKGHPAGSGPGILMVRQDGIGSSDALDLEARIGDGGCQRLVGDGIRCLDDRVPVFEADLDPADTGDGRERLFNSGTAVVAVHAFNLDVFLHRLFPFDGFDG